MPQDSDGESLARVLERLDGAVGRPRDFFEAYADPSEGLVVLAGHGRPRAQELGEAAAFTDGDLVLDRGAGPISMEAWGAVAVDEVLEDVAAVEDVQQLRTAA